MRANFIWKMFILTYATFLIGLFSYEIATSFFTTQTSMIIEVNESTRKKSKVNKPDFSDKKQIILNERPRWECFPVDADIEYRYLEYKYFEIKEKSVIDYEELVSLKKRRIKLLKKLIKLKGEQGKVKRELKLIVKQIETLEQKYYHKEPKIPVKRKNLLYLESCVEIK